MRPFCSMKKQLSPNPLRFSINYSCRSTRLHYSFHLFEDGRFDRHILSVSVDKGCNTNPHPPQMTFDGQLLHFVFDHAHDLVSRSAFNIF